MHPNPFSAGLRPGPRWGQLTSYDSPDPLVGWGWDTVPHPSLIAQY